MITNELQRRLLSERRGLVRPVPVKRTTVCRGCDKVMEYGSDKSGFCARCEEEVEAVFGKKGLGYV